jgi:hypothetical protein
VRTPTKFSPNWRHGAPRDPIEALQIDVKVSRWVRRDVRSAEGMR